jgi:1-deoxy-D-xylulose-5-phosphate reductoisomerase
MKSGLVVLGATGSVGRSTLDVVSRQAEPMPLIALTAHHDVAGLAALCREHRPLQAVIADDSRYAALCEALAGTGIKVSSGAEALCEVAAHDEAGTVMSAIVGAAGLLPTLAALRAGRRVLVANKEPLVMAGALVMRAAREGGATLLPIDSEHNAVFQCLPDDFSCGGRLSGVRRIVLTASGGPFRDWPLARIREATPAQAVAHPNWSMGRKISVDSATMMNKGLELIEAHWLFGLGAESLEVVVHPESIVHSLVEYEDGSMLAQMSHPDMRIPIAHALAYPERCSSGAARLDLSALGALHFRAADTERFPCLALAREVLDAGPEAANVMNAANEIAVEAFLSGGIGFTDIPGVIENVLDSLKKERFGSDDSLDAVIEIDRWARASAHAVVQGRAQHA